MSDGPSPSDRLPVNDRERLRALGRWADRFADPGFSIGRWEPSWTDDAGVIHMGWFEPSADVDAFRGEAARLGFIYAFDWPAWLQSPEGRALAADPSRVAGASGEDLARLLTSIVRSERVHEGSIEGAWQSGLLTAIVRRAAVLADAEAPDPRDRWSPGGDS